MDRWDINFDNYIEDALLMAFSEYSILPRISTNLYPNMPIDSVEGACIINYCKSSTIKDVATNLKIYIESKIFQELLHLGKNRGSMVGKISGAFDCGTMDDPIRLCKNNVLDRFVDIKSILDEACNWYTERYYCIIPPWVAGLIPQNAIRIDYGTIKPNGYIGMVDHIDMDIFVSNCVPKQYIFFGTRSALLFDIDMKITPITQNTASGLSILIDGIASGNNTIIVTYRYRLNIPERFGELHCIPFRNEEEWMNG